MPDRLSVVKDSFASPVAAADKAAAEEKPAKAANSGRCAKIPVSLLICLGMLAFALPVLAQPDCNAHGQLWSATAPPVNQRHIFCGELDHGTPKGYHSTQILPSNVVTHISNIQPNVAVPGTYNATAHFNNHTTKMSTFFPDACTVNQIVTSVVYAANNQTGPAPGWGVFGMSAPPAGGAAYCLDTNGSRFRIKMGLLANGNVNTAFPN